MDDIAGGRSNSVPNVTKRLFSVTVYSDVSTSVYFIGLSSQQAVGLPLRTRTPFRAFLDMEA